MAAVAGGLRAMIADHIQTAPLCRGCTLEEYELLAGSPAFYQDPNAPWVRRMCELSGAKPETASYGTNASSYDAGVVTQCIVFGPGSIEQASTFSASYRRFDCVQNIMPAHRL